MSIQQESRSTDHPSHVLHELPCQSPDVIEESKSQPSGSAHASVHDDSNSFPKFSDMSYAKVASILLSLSMATFIFAIEETIVATSVSAIGSAIEAKGSLAWISTGYLITQTALQPIVGRVADIVGAKRLLIIVIWIFIAGSLIAGLSNSMELLVAGRLISGVGAAGILSLVIIIISYLTNETQRGAYFNLINFVFIVADSTGPIIGSALAKVGQWRWLFLIAAPFGPIITYLLWRYVNLPHSPVYRGFKQTLKQTDVYGMILLVSWLSFVVIILNLGGQVLPWTHPTLIGLYVGTGVGFILFIVAEYYAELPVAPLKLFTNWEWRNVPIMLVGRTLLFFQCFAMIFYLPIFLRVQGNPSNLAAAMVIPFAIMAALSSILVSHVMTRWNHPRLSYHLPLLLLPVGIGLISTLTEASPLGQVAGYSIIAGFGFGGGTQITMIIAQNNLPLDILPTTTALISTAPPLGGVLGVGIVGTVINNIFTQNLHNLSYPISTWDGMNLNDVVSVLDHIPQGSPRRDLVIKAYVSAFQKGMYVLVAAAVFQIVISLPLRKVILDEGVKEKAKKTRMAELRKEEVANHSEREKQQANAGGNGENV
ncbi:major facilitator superfamily domain-containing protein [Flagelloscypha sp. PMI_526]|nr:major facilitator superfamily domain-containing protein [Flagelloscypha sp. PMI_526]